MSMVALIAFMGWKIALPIGRPIPSDRIIPGNQEDRRTICMLPKVQSVKSIQQYFRFFEKELSISRIHFSENSVKWQIQPKNRYFFKNVEILKIL